jgi:NADPH:quinone reductase-like Zn-dependent oxidoreductase
MSATRRSVEVPVTNQNSSEEFDTKEDGGRMSRFVRFTEFGPPDRLEIFEVEPPQAGPGQVRVQVRSAGLNPVDYKLLAGGAASAPWGIVPPSGNGNDYSGVLDEVGDGVSGLEAGTAVFGGSRFFAQADFVVVAAETVIVKPDDVDFDTAGALDIAGRAAIASVRSLHLTPSDTVLVSAAAGGVGILAVQLARRTGATVVGTASAGNHASLEALGVIPVEYGDGLAESVRAMVPRVTAVLDNNGAATIDAGLELGVPGHRINTIAARGHKTDFGIAGVGGQAASRTDLAALADLIARGEIVLPIDSVFPLERVVDAYKRLMAGHVRGKIVLAMQ